jgi:hypothetical protein
MIEKFLRGNKWQCRILGRGGEGVVNAMSCKPAAEIAFWQEWLGSERTRTISAAPGSFNSSSRNNRRTIIRQMRTSAEVSHIAFNCLADVISEM